MLDALVMLVIVVLASVLVLVYVFKEARRELS